MTKRLLEFAERVFTAILSGLACLGSFILIWVLLMVFAQEEPQLENAGIILFLSMLAIHLINSGISYFRSLLWEEELDELIREGSKTEQEIEADRLYKHLEVE